MEEVKNPSVETETTGPEVVETKSEQAEVNEEKTFTQAELDDIVKTRLAKAKSAMPSKEELQAFNDWKESQKTEAEKQAEKEKETLQVAAERDNLRKENLLLRKGVNEDDIDYVLYKVSKQEGEFTDNLEQFLADNPKYLKNYEEPQKTVDLGGNHTQEKADDNSEARRIMGLK